MNLTNAVLSTCQQLENFSATPRLEAELLVAFSCQQNRTFLYTHGDHPLLPNEEHCLKQSVDRRLGGEPMAYILGQQEFWSLTFKVTKDTLIPRPETEHLVEWILEHFSVEKQIHLADLGTGCGAIAIAIASERPDWEIDATDRSAAALKIAQYNAEKLHQPVKFYLGNWCDALPSQKYDILVSNPPYIAPSDVHLTDLRYEPLSALVAESNGLEALTKIANQAKHYLSRLGYLILEHGCTQSDAVKDILQAAGFINIQRHQDLAGLPRFITAQNS